MVRLQAPIGIFSRSGEGEYRWLVDFLKEKWSVSPFIITNTNYSLFCEEIYRCSFGILYHSRNRGRVNITNVTDSLYDEEVRTMSKALGKQRVIVVIDDLDDSSPETKKRILKHQYDLETQTQDIFLFTGEDKANRDLLRQRMAVIIDIITENVLTRHTERVSSIPVNIPTSTMQARDETGRRNKGWFCQILRKLVISALSLYVFYKAYNLPDLRNGLLAVSWAATTLRVFSIDVNRHVLPLGYNGRLTLSSIITTCIIYDTYYRSNAYNVVCSIMWLTSCSRNAWPRNQQLRRPVWGVISYGLVLLTFWAGWQQSDAETTLQRISQFVLRSPSIVAAAGI
ncbi:uncharacterized protein RB166_015761 isoform 1-T1 [Leptodactylus fuscus]|uniref:uncharacterized protein LOC142217730 isoform X1 n=1 Tax=Leptodactylus fuscus TaxID=238119 RepID=UPI003F4E5174